MTLDKSQHAYRWIRERIESGQFSPGYRLVLDAIARETGMSKVPVREAIRLLEAERLVIVQRNVGAQVAFMHEEEYLHTMQTLALVEGAATAMCASNLDPRRLARARTINEQMDAALNRLDPQRFSELNRSFHAELYGDCPNPHILDLVHRGWNRLALLRESVFGFVPERAAKSVREHDDLLRRIEAGASLSDIENAARRHRLNTLDAVLAHHDARRSADALAPDLTA
ncbi:GntR family transcriptional regulator [Nocardioides sp. NPDC127503]|uniref:GntR family transcriptional regulator n=1 Tax=Nocardioides sp. NPDC127503 TaxID=3154516 RepID=UPI003327E9A6